MAKTHEEMYELVKKVDEMVADGSGTVAACKKLGVPPGSLHYWRAVAKADFGYKFNKTNKGGWESRPKELRHRGRPQYEGPIPIRTNDVTNKYMSVSNGHPTIFTDGKEELGMKMIETGLRLLRGE